MYEFNHPDYPISSDATVADMEILKEGIVKSFEWLANSNCDKDLECATELLVNESVKN